MEILENFEWDASKNASNVEKHGIDFLFASNMFEGMTIEVPDNRVDYGEVRIIALGETENVVLFVVYT
jgi:uncharacterized DUF497 family protein